MQINKSVSVCISFGSNIGDRLNTIMRALTLLHASESIRIENISGIYETEPVGLRQQNDFLNGVVEIFTTMSAREVLLLLQQIEIKLGRTRDVRWGPRTIDLDILLYDNDVINDTDLIIPHPEMQNRKFVLKPLAEIEADRLVPGIHKSVKQMLAATTDDSRIRLYLTSADVKQKLVEG